MRLGQDVLLEIVDIVRRGIAEQKDVSQELRDLELEPDVASIEVHLSNTYLQNKGRQSADV